MRAGGEFRQLQQFPHKILSNVYKQRIKIINSAKITTNTRLCCSNGLRRFAFFACVYSQLSAACNLSTPLRNWNVCIYMCVILPATYLQESMRLLTQNVAINLHRKNIKINVKRTLLWGALEYLLPEKQVDSNKC